MRSTSALTLASLLAVQGLVQAATPNYPVAVRWWGQGMVSIETWWDLTVVIDPYSDSIGYEVPELTADLVLVTHEHSDHNNVEAVKGEPTIVRGLSPSGEVDIFDQVLDRWPRTEKVKWLDSRSRISPSPFAIQVQCIPAWHDNVQGAERGATAMFKITVDGVRILHCGDLGQSTLTDEQVQEIGEVDVMLLPVGGVYTIDGEQAWDIIAQVKPRIVVPIHYKTDKLKIPLEIVDKFFLNTPLEEWKFKRPINRYNTIAVRPVAGDQQVKRGMVAILNHEPWEPSGDLAELLDNMDAACQASQKVFAPLSVEQMNWQPPNGSHTPRWNAEHMMGRQLGFFSQIYATIEPETFKHIDLNPAQMPEDYRAAHPDWDGAEEARQMQRANAYVRRFAYLLDGLDLDAKAPGSFWTPRKLLKQMDRHFGEHTANVEKKFELEGWPTD